MKRLLVLFLSVHCSLFTVHCFTQPCLPDGIYFNTQEEIDNFQINYPNCTEIEGDVQICGDDIVNLHGLDVLTSIWGSLRINSNNILTSLAGLEGLTSIGGNLEIGYYPGWGHNALINLTGLEGLTSIGGDLLVFGNDDLTSLAGLDNIDANSIADIYIQDNDLLSTCEETWLCNYLANPNGSVNIYGNASGCNNPAEIADSCGFTMPCLPFGNYYFNCQDEIDSFQVDYPNCTELEGNIRIKGEDIINLMGLNVINTVGGDLWIWETSLQNLEGLNNLTFIGGKLQFISNYITSLAGLESLDSINGNLIFGWASSPTGGNSLLTSLTGLETLTYAGGLIINGNGGLTNLDGLYNLTSIGGYLKLNLNAALTSLAGIGNIDAASIDNLIIMNNYSLSTCEVESICDYLASPTGSIDIHNNATGCNSIQEVEEACGIVDIEELNIIHDIVVTPNPFNTNTTISYNLYKPENIRFTVYNLQSKIVLTIQEWQDKGQQRVQWNAEGLPAGMYYFRLQAGDKVGGGKMMKISD